MISSESKIKRPAFIILDNLSDGYLYKPILEFYPDGIITTINATQPPVKVLAEMIQRITSLPVYDEMAKRIV